MTKKPTYEELEQRVKKLEKEAVERKRAEEELNHQKRHLESLIEYSSLSIVTLDERHNIISCNRDFEKLFHFKESEIVGINLDELITSQEYINDATSYTKETLKGKAIHGSGKRKRKDGTYLDVEFTGVPVIIDRKVIGAYGIYHDISERKQLEEAAQRRVAQVELVYEVAHRVTSELELKALFSEIVTAVCDEFDYYGVMLLMVDEETNRLNMQSIAGGYADIFPKDLWLAKGEGMIGYAAATGETQLSDDVTKHPHYVLKAEEETKSELAVPIKSGQEVIGVLDLQSSQFNAFDKTDVVVMETLADQIAVAIKNARLYETVQQELTDRKQTEETLKESEKRFRDISYSMADWIWEVDDNGRYIFASGKVKEILGYPPEELIGKTPFDLMPEDEAKRIGEVFKRIVSEKKPIVDLENWNLTKKGKKICLLTNGVPMSDESGVLIGYRGVDKDITEAKLAEKERKKLETQLQQAQKMETIGILAGGVAHDLNNILSGIISYPELLLMDLPEDSPLRKPLLTIKSSGEKAAVVVQDLLTLARRGVTITEIVNLNSIISEQLKSPECEKLKSFHPNVDIKTNPEKDLLNINGSTAHLSKTVMNLISNAAEAMPDGGKVLISTENLYIDRPIKRYDQVDEGDYVTVTVIDTGIGISEEDIERIFEPFYTKKVMGRSGSGLGMSVVWGTVKDHNGYIDVESTKGKGTTFTLYFPVTRQELAIDKSLLSIEDYMGKGESILIVDDVEEQREIASVMLNKLGYSVMSVSSGEEAIEYMKDNSADLLVLDMIMDPGIDGLETYKRILKLHPKQKAIIASGFSETDRVKKAKKLGAGAYVKKPYVLEKIGVVIKEELEK